MGDRAQEDRRAASLACGDAARRSGQSRHIQTVSPSLDEWGERGRGAGHRGEQFAALSQRRGFREQRNLGNTVHRINPTGTGEATRGRTSEPHCSLAAMRERGQASAGRSRTTEKGMLTYGPGELALLANNTKNPGGARGAIRPSCSMPWPQTEARLAFRTTRYLKV